MARIRSPNYPAISLREAMERVGKAFAKENRHSAPADVMAKALGFGAFHGASAAALSALVKYGLLEKSDDTYRVSERAITILHPRNPQEKAQAVREAAEAPALFADILAEYPGGLPSDDNLRAYLIRKHFSPTALPAVIQSLRDTMELAFPSGSDPTPSDIAPEEETRMQGSQVRMSAQAPRPTPHVRAHTGAPAGVQETTFTPASDTEPFRVSFTGNGIEVSAKLTSPEIADDLVRAVNALKLLLRPLSPNKPSQPDTPSTEAPTIKSTEPVPHGTDPTREGIPFMITRAQKEALRKLGYTDADISNIKPEEAHRMLSQSGAVPAN